jgi:hypothetical protein
VRERKVNYLTLLIVLMSFVQAGLFLVLADYPAGDFLGGKWDDEVVGGLEYWDSTVISGIPDALYYWNQADIIPNFDETTGESAHFCFYDYYNSQSGVYGYAVLLPDEETDPYTGAYVYINRYEYNLCGSQQKKWIINHEAGHVLGLEHYGTYNVMSQDYYTYGPTATDVGHVNQLYGEP